MDTRELEKQALERRAVIKATFYAVQGLYRNEWMTLFAPYERSSEAKTKMIDLQEANPACKYRYVRVTYV